MSTTDPRAPLIAGVCQRTWRDACPGPAGMLAEVSRLALEDAGGNVAGLDRVDALCVIRYVSADHPNAPQLIADGMGISAERLIHTSIGGDTPQAAVGELAGRIAAGQADSVLLCGGEALATVAAHLKQGSTPDWGDPPTGSLPDEILGTDREANRPEEVAAGLIAPLMIYPLFESALWAEEGGDVDALRSRLGELQARFSKVAAGNPHAWSPGPFDAGFISTPSPANRLVTLPYTKLMNSNIQTDQAAALFICSHERANALGVPPDRRVYLHGSAHSVEPWFFSGRGDLGRSPALRAASSAALDQAAIGIDDVDLLDLYSCFPSAVRIAGRELGIDPRDDPRAPTVTGGLAFAGGPGNAYVLHSIAAMVERLRERPSARGLVTAVGWYMTKHAVGVYGALPPARPYAGQTRIAEPPAAVEVAPSDRTGSATAETGTVIFERDGSPSFGMVTALFADGSRVLRSSSEAPVLAGLLREPVAGRRVEIRDGTFEFS